MRQDAFYAGWGIGQAGTLDNPAGINEFLRRRGREKANAQIMFHKGQNLVGRFCFNHGLVFQLLFKEIGHIKFIAAAVSWQRNEGSAARSLRE